MSKSKYQICQSASDARIIPEIGLHGDFEGDLALNNDEWETVPESMENSAFYRLMGIKMIETKMEYGTVSYLRIKFIAPPKETAKHSSLAFTIKSK